MGGTGRAVTGWRWVVSFLPPPPNRPRYSWGHNSLSPQNRALSGIQSWSELFMCSRISYKKHTSGHPRLRIVNVTLCGRVHVGWMMVRDAMHEVLCSALSVYFIIASLQTTHCNLPTSTISSPRLYMVIHAAYMYNLCCVPCCCSSVTTRAPSYYNRLRFQQ
jgi:hypothetical protein